MHPTLFLFSSLVKIKFEVHLICNMYHMYPQNKWHTFFMKYAPVGSVSNNFFRSRIAIHIWYCTRITSISHFFQFRRSQRYIREIICYFSNVTETVFKLMLIGWHSKPISSKHRFENQPDWWGWRWRRRRIYWCPWSKCAGYFWVNTENGFYFQKMAFDGAQIEINVFWQIKNLKLIFENNWRFLENCNWI